MPQLTHLQVWAAIDALAAAKGFSASGLAKRAGLDATTFNPSKRRSPDGRDRWPSTESIAKILDATQTGLDEFVALIERTVRRPKQSMVPLIGLAQAGAGGFFDDAGLPTGQGWDEVAFPGAFDGPVYALEITGDSMLPLYRSGDVIIVAPAEKLRKGDRVVVKTGGGEVMAKILTRQTAKTVELASFNPDHAPRSFSPREIDWIARIVWASQ